MPLWGFGKESTQSAAGANTQAARKKGFQAPSVAGDTTEMVEKRNVILTQYGWVRRERRASVNGADREIDTILVAGHPTNAFGYANANFTMKPDISQIYVKLNANGVLSANATNANLYVVFNTPVSKKASGNLASILISNTTGGNHAVSYFQNTAAQGRIVNANNTLVFRMPKLQARAQANGEMATVFEDDVVTNTVANTRFTVGGVAFDSTEVDVIAAANGSQLASTLAAHSQLRTATWSLATKTLTLVSNVGWAFALTGNTAYSNSSGGAVGDSDTLSGGNLQAPAVYHVNAQAITLTGNPLYNPDRGLKLNSAANLTITGAVANNLLDGVGNRVVNFSVTKNGVPV